MNIEKVFKHFDHTRYLDGLIGKSQKAQKIMIDAYQDALKNHQHPFQTSIHRYLHFVNQNQYSF